jgi:hypothetical protein
VAVFTSVVTTVWDPNCGDYLLQEKPNEWNKIKRLVVSVVNN